MFSEYFKSKMQNHFNEIEYIECDAKNSETFSKSIDFTLRLNMKDISENSKWYRRMPVRSQATHNVTDCELLNFKLNFDIEKRANELANSSCYYDILDYELVGCEDYQCHKKRKIDYNNLHLENIIQKEYCDMV